MFIIMFVIIIIRFIFHISLPMRLGLTRLVALSHLLLEDSNLDPLSSLDPHLIKA
jgi:hypothetical protein